MLHLLLAVIYISFISLGLPDSLLGAALTRGAGWQMGYRVIGILQLVLTVLIVLSLPLWKTRGNQNETGTVEPSASLPFCFRWVKP